MFGLVIRGRIFFQEYHLLVSSGIPTDASREVDLVTQDPDDRSSVTRVLAWPGR
jgi:hypothetical protein